MTDKEIRKALECCSRADECIYEGLTYKGESLRLVIKEALELINRYETEVEGRRAEVEELRFRLDRSNEEKSNISLMIDETLKENEVLKKKVEFLSGQCEAYKYCISKIGGE